MSSDLVSIIMPSYNTAKYIAESINSVLAQTYTNWELLVVDDCSTDSSVEIIKNYCTKDERIQLFVNDKNSGAAASRNKALRGAAGRWIAFLDSDDLWLPEKLEKQITFMENNGYKFSYTDYRIQLNGKWLPYVNTGPNKVTKHKLKNYCYFSTITVMYDRKYIGLIQIEPIKKNNDYAMWLKIIEKANCYRLPECLSFYIKHNGSISSGCKVKLIKYHYIMWRIAERKCVLSAIVLTIRNLFYGFLKKIKYKQHIEENRTDETL